MGICYFFLCVEPHTKFLCLQQGRGLILVEGGGGGGWGVVARGSQKNSIHYI